MNNIIRLFRGSETDFEHNEWILSETIKAIVTEDLDGNFELDLEYPLFDKKGLSKYLIRGNIISCSVGDERKEQLFVIRKFNKNTKSRRITVYAQAIARTKLSINFVPGCEIKNKTRKQAIKQILDNCIELHGLSVGNLDNNTNTSINMGIDDSTGEIIDYLDTEEKSPLDCLIDDKNSIKEAYGGELRYDNFIIDMVDQRKADTTFYISSGKNLEELENEIDEISDDFATALIMVSQDELHLPEYVIKSPNFNKYSEGHYKLVRCDDIQLIDDSQEAIEIVYAQLRERAAEMFNEDKIDVPKLNYKINFIELQNTEEFKHVEGLQKAYLGNTVEVYYPKIEVTATERIIKTKFNVLKNKYEEIEIGEKLIDIKDIINGTKNEVIETNKNVVKTKKKLKDDIKEEAEERKNLQVTFEARADSIELSVENVEKETKASIKVLEGEIELKVDEDDFGTLIEQNSRHVTIAVHDETDMLVTFDSDGQTIDDGALTVKNKGKTVFYFNDGIACVKDIYFMDGGDQADNFIQAISEPKTIWVNDISGDDANFKNLDVDYSKNCLQTTEHYGKRRISAYETAEYYFGDLGFGIIKNGSCVVTIDEIFKECVNTNIDYHIFTQVYIGSIERIEKHEEYFIVYGKENTEFSWEIKAKRIGYENVRLEQKGLVDEAQQKVNTSTVVNNYIKNNSSVITTDLINKNNDTKNDLLEVIGL